MPFVIQHLSTRGIYCRFRQARGLALVRADNGKAALTRPVARRQPDQGIHVEWKSRHAPTATRGDEADHPTGLRRQSILDTFMLRLRHSGTMWHAHHLSAPSGKVIKLQKTGANSFNLLKIGVFKIMANN